jgi:uncharacterized protein (TIGR03790 family)
MLHSIFKLNAITYYYLVVICFLLIAFDIRAEGDQNAISDVASSHLKQNNLALIINNADQRSVNVANYYQAVHHIPDENMIYVNIESAQPTITSAAFSKLKTQIVEKLQAKHKAVLFVWTTPYAVECQSITSAFTLGFDPKLCQQTCKPSQPSPYFNQASKNPLHDFNLRLSMLLPSDAFEVATKVIDNGFKSQSGVFKSTAYFLKTSDKARNSRAGFFPKNGISFKGTGLSVSTQKNEYLEDVHDIMIYHTGRVFVPGLETLNFLPGALADHLTSTGGNLYGQSQMPILNWLKAGATASYGTVSEPCNYWQKFPNSAVLLKWYALGATAIEAYWKSVAWPAQGLFVGDPLAAPYAH